MKANEHCRETAAYVEALRRIYELTKPSHHSKAARQAHAVARDALAACGRGAEGVSRRNGLEEGKS